MNKAIPPKSYRATSKYAAKTAEQFKKPPPVVEKIKTTPPVDVHAVDVHAVDAHAIDGRDDHAADKHDRYDKGGHDQGGHSHDDHSQEGRAHHEHAHDHDHDHHGHPLFHVDGLGGHIEVFPDRLVIHRHGLLHIILELLLFYEGSTETVLPIRNIAAVNFIEPMVFPGYIRFSYEGSPDYSKDYWTDAMAPNTLLMGYFDHRPFLRLRDFIVETQAKLT